MRRKTADRLTRIETALGRVEEALSGLGGTLDPGTSSGLAAGLHAKLGSLDGKIADLAETIRAVMAARAEHDASVAADAKAARQSAEASFAGVQALASVATAQPGLGELAGAVATNTEAIRAVHAAVKAMPAPVPVKAAEAVPMVPGGTGTAGKGAGKQQGGSAGRM